MYADHNSTRRDGAAAAASPGYQPGKRRTNPFRGAPALTVGQNAAFKTNPIRAAHQKQRTNPFPGAGPLRGRMRAVETNPIGPPATRAKQTHFSPPTPLFSTRSVAAETNPTLSTGQKYRTNPFLPLNPPDFMNIRHHKTNPIGPRHDRLVSL